MKNFSTIPLGYILYTNLYYKNPTLSLNKDMSRASHHSYQINILWNI